MPLQTTIRRAAQCAILMFTSQSLAQGCDHPLLAARLQIEASLGIECFAVGDLNGDSIDDIVIGGEWDQLWLYLGREHDLFGPRVIMQNMGGMGAFDLVLLDYDGDEDLDILAVWIWASSVFLNDGNGEFASPLYIEPTVGAAADFDGNAEMDLVTAEYGLVGVRLNGQSFVYIDELGGWVRDIEVADIDNDGDLDFLTVNSSERDIVIFLNNGDGTFAIDKRLKAPINAHHLITLDVNQDGYKDIATIGPSGNGVLLYINDDRGGFPYSMIVTTAPLASSIVAGDVDNDGDEDLVVAIRSSVGAQLLRNLGGGEFSSPIQLPVSGLGKAIALLDLNGDDLLDVLVASSETESIELIFNADIAHQEPLKSIPLNESLTSEVLMEDLNGDGDRDFIYNTGYYSNRQLLIQFNDSSAGHPTFALESPHGSPFEPIAADFDGDGTIDIAVRYSPALGAVAHSIFFNDGNGAFPRRDDYNFTPLGSFADVADMDGDGDLDIIGPAQGGFGIWYNNGDGTLSSPIFVTSSFADQLAPGDFNGDGSVDVGAYSGFYGRLVIMTNNGDGTFTESYRLSDQYIPKIVSAADLDGDGRSELLIGVTWPEQLLHYTDNGSGGFKLLNQYRLTTLIRTIHDANMNRDGRLDLILQFDHSVGIMMNSGDGSLEPDVHYGAGEKIYSPHVVDVDNDGDKDIMCVASPLGVVTLENLCNH